MMITFQTSVPFKNDGTTEKPCTQLTSTDKFQMPPL